MTKPLPFGCIKKEKEIPDLRKFNFILQNLLPNNKIGLLFVVDIIFDEKKAVEKSYYLMKFTRQFFKRTS